MHGLIVARDARPQGGAPSLTAPALFLELGARSLLERLVDTFSALGASTLTCVVDEDHAAAAAALVGVHARILATSTRSSLHAIERGLAALPEGPVFCAPVTSVMRLSDWRRTFAVAAAEIAAGAEAMLTVTPAQNGEHPLYVERKPGGLIARISEAPIEPVCFASSVCAFSRDARVLAADLVARGKPDVGTLLRLMVGLGLDVTSTLVERVVDVDRLSALDAARALLAVDRPPAELPRVPR